MTDHPTGTVTFLFTDIEGSTRLWSRHRELMQVALARHDEILRDAVEAHGGWVFKTGGDAFFAAFDTTTGAVAAALHAGKALQAEDWRAIGPLRVRIALHTGVADERDGDYFGPPLNLCSRLLGVAHGDQCLVSSASEELVRDWLPEGARLVDLGEHRLRDVEESGRIFQLAHPGLRADFPALLSLGSFPNNLPHQTTSFIGRQAEIDRAKALLDDGRLVTVTGIGGSGKTRVCLKVAADLVPTSADGTWLVELATLTAADQVPLAVVRALGLGDEAATDATERLADYLAEREVLLVLDNCEHLLDASASLAEALLRRCPKLRVLASSRERLGVSGERVLALPPLSTPDLALLLEPERLSRYDSVALFVDRAELVLPLFALTHDNAASVASICARLDGVPLAIELAAARTKMLTPQDIASRLDQRFRLLTGGSRTALPRQRTLQAAMDWSHDLLSHGERVLLRRLAAFAGGWTLEDAEPVCEGDGIERFDVLDLLCSLVDKSLVVAGEAVGQSRYRMLQTVQQYALERLVSEGAVDRLRDRHLTHYLGLAEAAESGLYGPDIATWIRRLDAQHDNLRAAMQWSCDSGSIESGLRIGSSVARYWLFRCRVVEGIEALSACVEAARAAQRAGRGPGETEQPGPAVDRAVMAAALEALGVLHRDAGNLTMARGLIEDSLDMYREIGDQGGEAQALTMLGDVHGQLGDIGTELELEEQAASLAQEIGDDRRRAVAETHLGMTRMSPIGDLAGAYGWLESAERLSAELGDAYTRSYASRCLGHIDLLRGDLDQAGTRLERELSFVSDVGETWRLSLISEDLGFIQQELGNLDAAEGHYASARDRMARLGDGVRESRAARMLGTLALLRGRNDEALHLLGAWLTTARSLGLDLDWISAQLAYCEALQIAGEDHAARQQMEEALSIASAQASPSLVVVAQYSLARLALARNDVAEAERWTASPLEFSRQGGVPHWVAAILTTLAQAQQAQGELEAARASYVEALAIHRSNAVRPTVSDVLDHLARLETANGDFAAAQARLDESLRIRREMTARPRVVESLAECAILAACRGDRSRALTLAGASEAHRSSMGMVMSPPDRYLFLMFPIVWRAERLGAAVASARQALPESEADAALKSGGAMTLEDAMELALAGAGA